MKLLAGMGRAYLLASAALATLAIVVVVALGISGAIRMDRLRAAAQALRGDRPAVEPPRPAAPPPPTVDEAWKEFEEARRTARKAQEDRARELDVLDARLTARLALVEVEKQGLEKIRREHDTAAREARQALEELAAAKSDAEMDANLPILSRMDGAAALSLMKGWEDRRIVRYLRGMRPSKAAEVLDAMRTDPMFDQEFRQLPAGAPPGSRTRAELLMEEFKKAPEGAR